MRGLVKLDKFAELGVPSAPYSLVSARYVDILRGIDFAEVGSGSRYLALITGSGNSSGVDTVLFPYSLGTFRQIATFHGFDPSGGATLDTLVGSCSVPIHVLPPLKRAHSRLVRGRRPLCDPKKFLVIENKGLGMRRAVLFPAKVALELLSAGFYH